ncbi:MAG: glycosyltransferase family 2 protein [Acidimicrobiales bacterium]
MIGSGGPGNGGHGQRAVGLIGWTAGWWLLWSLPPPAAAPPGPTGGRPPAPSMSVVIPVRDEERALPVLLASLARQRRAPEEVVVVDDHSVDRSAEVARARGATVVASRDLPEGWTGKTWACHQGAEVAGGDLLVFLDADVRLAPDALERLEAEHLAHGGLVSVQPFHLPERIYERMSAVANVVVLMATGAFTAPPRRPAAMAFGPCLVIGRDDYGRAGHCHPEVRPLVAEDIGMARQCRRIGRPVRARAGRDVVSFRMYPEGVAQLVEGWTKGLAYGARHTPAPLAALVALWVSGACLATGTGARVVGAVARGRPLPLRAIVCYGAWAAQMGWMMRRVGRFGAATAIAFPAPLVVFVALSARSAFRRALRRPPRWRGRQAPVA